MSTKKHGTWLAWDRIIADLEGVQSRAAMSKDDEREFSEAMRERGWGTFPPLIIFFDGKKYWLADGFHRYFAAKKAGLVDVKVDIREGTKRDAIIHSAGSNLKFSIKRTTADIRRAVRMLLADPEWSKRTAVSIAEHCGTHPSSVTKWRHEYSIETGVPLPEFVESESGRKVPCVFKRSKVPEIRGDERGGYFASVARNKRVYLGKNEEDAKARLSGLIEDQEARRTSINLPTIANRLRSAGLVVERVQRKEAQSSRLVGLPGLRAGDAVVTSCLFRGSSDFQAAVGCALLLRCIHGVARAVVLCYREDGPDGLFAFAESLGVEFLAPDEFVASLKPESSAGEAA